MCWTCVLSVATHTHTHTHTHTGSLPVYDPSQETELYQLMQILTQRLIKYWSEILICAGTCYFQTWHQKSLVLNIKHTFSWKIHRAVKATTCPQMWSGYIRNSQLTRTFVSSTVRVVSGSMTRAALAKVHFLWKGEEVCAPKFTKFVTMYCFNLEVLHLYQANSVNEKIHVQLAFCAWL